MILLYFCYCDLLHFPFLANELIFCGLNLNTFTSQNANNFEIWQDNRNLKYTEMSHQWFLRSRMTVLCGKNLSLSPLSHQAWPCPNFFFQQKMEERKNLGWLAKQNTSCLKIKEAQRIFQEGQSTGSVES